MFFKESLKLRGLFGVRISSLEGTGKLGDFSVEDSFEMTVGVGIASENSKVVSVSDSENAKSFKPFTAGSSAPRKPT